MKVPHDTRAEANLVGCALARSRPMASDLSADCYVPSHARLLAAAKDLHDVVPRPCDPDEVDWAELWPFTYPDFEHLRASAAAVLADVDLGLARRLVDERFEPAAGRDVLVVGRAARARRAMAVLADAYNVLGDGGDVDDVAELVSGVVG